MWRVEVAGDIVLGLFCDLPVFGDTLCEIVHYLLDSLRNIARVV